MPVKTVPIVAVAADGAAEIAPLTRTGATLSATSTGTSPRVVTISAAGDIAVGDTVFHDIVATAPSTATEYTVDAIGGGSITLSWTGGGSRTVTTAKVLSPGNHTLGIISLLGYQVATTLNTGTVAFASGTTALTGTASLLAGRPVSVPPSKAPVCRSLPNQMLYVLTATAGTLSGYAVVESQ